MLIIAEDSIGARLDQFLAAQLPELSRARIQALIKAGDVTVNGKEDVLVNTDSALSISGIAIVYLLLLLVDLLLLVRACKIRYYIWQEQQLQLG